MLLSMSDLLLIRYDVFLRIRGGGAPARKGTPVRPLLLRSCDLAPLPKKGPSAPCGASEKFRLWISEGLRRKTAFAHIFQQRERNWQFWQAQPKLRNNLSRSIPWRTSGIRRARRP